MMPDTPNAHSAAAHPDTHAAITPARLTWQEDDHGSMVPVSGEFGDVYFSHVDGLAESRYVFIEHNHLPERLQKLQARQCFTVAEIGFGTGLNVLALWQLWRTLRAAHSHLADARLHIITTEKYPLTLSDLTQILRMWQTRAPELGEMIEALLAAYPPLIAGCHRLHFDNDNVTLDIWLGDASASFLQWVKPSVGGVDAWFLDGFAPSCNEDLWATTIFESMQRLSSATATAATFSCAGVVKRGLKAHGFEIKKVKGFGRKREMLIAWRAAPDSESTIDTADSTEDSTLDADHDAVPSLPYQHVAVIGAGISGLMAAHTLASRGVTVTLLDKQAPLAGASGNPRALLAPKMTPLSHAAEHLHTVSYLYSGRFYRQMDGMHTDPAAKTDAIVTPTGTMDLLTKANITAAQACAYPESVATALATEEARALSGLSDAATKTHVYLPQAALINPQALKEVILAHPRIRYQTFEVAHLSEQAHGVQLLASDTNSAPLFADAAIVCGAYDSPKLVPSLFACRKIRGQLSWFTPSAEQLDSLPKLPLKYGGYCAPFVATAADAALNPVQAAAPQFLLGASFVRNDTDTAIRVEEHQHNRDKLVSALPELEDILPSDVGQWQARVGIRAQTPDYHPLVGQVTGSQHIWTLCGMGSKGYAFAPLCAQVLADMMGGNIVPVSQRVLASLSPQRARLQKPLNSL
ncbi:FAD-dependent 5-carboxymethylaminomethyl-2-thiouridine(34) oxidoreductase MnmC [Psychrobacter aestuarii]|uniref:tRNA 5-methylaminomethyl-2-thiouridine biosynthesis bifunctional protein MnmC n=1 Tax=Psychrobacter aestuarii TaxID=556327 RepID=A0ABN0VLI4_9GAMM|nr:FAD-dependent 5-carboxymethylaminomethyl-2-thiouridine(34) oxidoreductase MnmC [Psychrobacter aestuarii]